MPHVIRLLEWRHALETMLTVRGIAPATLAAEMEVDMPAMRYWLGPDNAAQPADAVIEVTPVNAALAKLGQTLEMDHPLIEVMEA